jgi:hydroxymethylbilane synthase
MTLLRLGTRGSELALTQSRWVADELMLANEGLRVELQVIKTSGDRDQNSALNQFGGKGIFTKEIEDALLAGDIDLAVHSLKDLPTQLPAGLTLAMPPKREDARDLLISKVPLSELGHGALIGTGSARRREQLRHLCPDFNFAEIRGNVGTRVRKWREGHCDATVLACAGVARLGLEVAGLSKDECFPLSYDMCLPAPNQGLLGIEYRQDDQATSQLLLAIADADAGVAFQAERAFLAELDGGCHIPAGAITEVGVDEVFLRAFLSQPGKPPHKVMLRAPRGQAAEVGREAARILKAGPTPTLWED